MIGQNDNINLEVYEKKNVVLGFYGLFYVFILAVIIILGWVYLNNLETFSRNDIVPPYINTDTVKKEADLPVIKGTISAPVDIAKEIVSTPEKTAKGKLLFETNCSSCHGNEGKGDGVAGKTLNPPPRNFHELTGWTNGPSFSMMYKTMEEGIISRGMASYNNLPPSDRINLILYIRTFKNDYPPIDQNEISTTDKIYSLSSGIKQPSQIPVRAAEEKLIEEYSSSKNKIDKITDAVLQEKTDMGAAIFRRISTDIRRSVTALHNNTSWNENEARFVKFITVNPESKGFRASLPDITSDDLTTVFIYLKSLFSK